MAIDLPLKAGGVPPRGIEYRVLSTAYGIAIFGEFPVDHLGMFVDQAAKRGWDQLDTMISASLGASIAMTGGKDQKAWRKALNCGDANPDWVKSGDIGTSSMTIYETLRDPAMTPAPLRGRAGDVPHDPDDFGRCYRLLKRFPEWRARLGEVASRHPAWGPMVREWDRMTALYERDVNLKTQKGKSAELYDLMRTLVDEGRKGSR